MVDTKALRETIERHARLDANENLDQQEWAEVLAPSDALALLDRLDALQDENGKLREFIAASKECAEARAIVEVEASNERYRKAFTEIVERLQQPGSGVRSVLCSWCREQWPQLDGDTPDDVRQHAREHAFRCASHPMRIERDQIREQLAAMTAARDELASIADDLNGDNGDDEELERRRLQISTLRGVGK